MERELKAVNKAREALGDKAPTFATGRERDGKGLLGKRRRHENDSSDDTDVPEDVRSIPMPRDTPPPIPKEVLDSWHARRRARWQARNQEREEVFGDHSHRDTAPIQDKVKEAQQPTVQSRTVYESAPIVRDLTKEAVKAFVPTAVRTKLEKSKGQNGLIEPEEADKLEKEGYLKVVAPGSKHVTIEEADDDGD